MEYEPKRIVYVAGPFRASSTWAIEQNIRKAEEAALNIWRVGAVALCPHLNTRFFQGAAPDEVWLSGDLELLRRCDAVLMLPNWEDSAGSTVEYKYALAWGLKVLLSHEALVEWLNEDENVRDGSNEG